MRNWPCQRSVRTESRCDRRFARGTQELFVGAVLLRFRFLLFEHVT